MTTVRLGLPGQLDGLGPAGGGPGELGVRAVGQQGGQAVAEQRMIVGDQDPDRFGHSCSRPGRVGIDPGSVRKVGLDHQVAAEFGDALAHRRDADAGPPAFRQAHAIIADVHVQAMIEPQAHRALGACACLVTLVSASVTIR